MSKIAYGEVSLKKINAFCGTLIVGMLLFLSGCAVVKATQQPEKKDVSLLKQGVPRTHLIAEYGKPVWSEERDGKVTDVFCFTQGYSKETKAGRAVLHGAADVATIGLWEVVGYPYEAWADGTEVQLEVRYDASRNVETVKILRGDEAIHPQPMLARLKKKKLEPAGMEVINDEGATLQATHVSDYGGETRK